MNRGTVSEAIVLSSRPYSEADKLVTVFSKHYGKITLIAKGVKRLKSRKRGALEVFSLMKYSAFTGRGMPIMTEAETIDNFAEIRGDLKKVSVAYFFLEAVSRTTRDEEAHVQVFDLLKNNLSKLKSEEKLKKLRNDFTVSLAEMLGFIPEKQNIINPDALLESIIERKMGSVRVGKKLQG